MNEIVLVTGTGMDSKTITHLLLSKKETVIMAHRRNSSLNLDELYRIYENDLKQGGKLELVLMDITDYNSVSQSVEYILNKYNRIDKCFNLAAQSHVGDSFKNEIYTIQATGMGLFNVANSLRLLSPATKIFQASTSEMFGGDPNRDIFNENSEFELRSPYAIAKALAYNWVKYFRQTYGMFICSAFCFNHSNIYRNSSFYVQRVCQSAARISLGKQKELTLGNINFWRDESYADFCVEAFHKMLQLDKPEDFIIARGQCFHGEEFLDEAFGYFNLDWKNFVCQDKNLLRPNDVIKLVGNPQKAIDKLDWRPNRMSFKDHIALMCRYDYQLEIGLKPVRPNVFEMYP